MKQLYQELPSSVDRLGPETFLKIPLFARSNKLQPLYINHALYSTFFPEASELQWQALSEHAAETFNVTIDEQESESGQVGWAYVDYQTDVENPLNGNAGSGRAYFAGKQFNIKGELTPLAQEHTPGLGHYGILSMGFAIWSTLTANTLVADGDVQLAPILAILDCQQSHEKYGREVKHVLVVRVDLNGEMDRVNNHIHHQTPLKQQDFDQAIEAMAVQSAEKYIHRILHGAVHSGNLTLAGQLIDYDTVGFTKGRQPQTSYGSHHIEDFFGFEHLACHKILQSLTSNVLMNVNQVSLDDCLAQFEQRFEQHIAKKMLYLLGFQDYERLYLQHQAEVDVLAKVFRELSTYTMVREERSFNDQHPITLLNYYYDFSALFRTLGLNLLQNKLTLENGLNALVGEERFLDESDDNIFPFHLSHQAFPNEIQEMLSQFSLPESDELQVLDEAALNFIKSLSTLYQLLLTESSYSLEQIASQAYILNEDRLYLLHPFKLNRFIIQQQSPLAANQWIHKIIDASQRSGRLLNDNPIADVRLYEQGRSFIQFNSTRDQFQWVFEIDKTNVDTTAEFSIRQDDRTLPATVSEQDGRLRIQTELQPLHQLALTQPREQVFQVRLFELLSQGERQLLTDLYYQDQDIDRYL